MNNKRRNPMMVRLLAVIAVTMMFTMCFVGGTFAKYTSSATGTDSATVARWDIKVNSANIAITDTFTFDLFKTITDSDQTSPENDMNPVDGSIIAPGTSGKFDIVIKNDSQVNATYAIDYSVTNTKNIPVQFSIDGTTWKTDINDLDVAGVAINIGEEKTVTVQWKWIFDGDDTIDTPLGAEATATLTVEARVTAIQVE